MIIPTLYLVLDRVKLCPTIHVFHIGIGVSIVAKFSPYCLFIKLEIVEWLDLANTFKVKVGYQVKVLTSCLHSIWIGIKISSYYSRNTSS